MLSTDGVGAGFCFHVFMDKSNISALTGYSGHGFGILCKTALLRSHELRSCWQVLEGFFVLCPKVSTYS